jgi:signal recognition particle receptor subunit beta
VHVDPEQREIAIKLVYYGAALSGKTTNLKTLHAHADARSRGRLLSLDSQSDRTLFFDLLPLHFRAGDVTVKVRVYTVPGQVMHNATRKIVLQAVDGVAFVADSRRSEVAATGEAFANLKENLRENGLDPDAVPIVVQFNKRDLPDIRSDEELARVETRGRPVYAACALQGEGVLKTFFALARLTWDDLERRHGLAARFHITRDAFLETLGAVFGKRL